MTVDLVGVNLNALTNLPPPNITINQTAGEILANLPLATQATTGGLYSFLILGTIFLITFWYLTDRNPLSDFRYSYLRGLTLALALTSSIGITQIMTGMIYSWMAVVFFLLSYLVSEIMLIMVENKN